MVSTEPKVAVVTGATSGIGRAVAEGLARRGMMVVAVGRGSERVQRVADEISHSAQNPNVLPLAVTDLGLRGEMHRVARAVRERCRAIDVLVNNAGGYFHRRELTEDGLERTFALNVLAPFVLTQELVEPLASAAPSRVVQISSEAHRGARIDLDDVQGERGYRGLRAYGRSKLELILLTRELARRLGPRGISVNAVHPGFVASGFGRNNSGVVGGTWHLLSALFGRRVPHGADPVIFAATDPSLESVTGAYLARRTVRPGSPSSRDADLARRLYDLVGQLAATA